MTTKSVTRFICAALLLLVAGCDDSGEGLEKGVWCRPNADGTTRVLILDGDHTYWVYNGTQLIAWEEEYEMEKEDGEWYWHSWLNSEEYGNRVEALEPERLFVIADNVNDRLIYYHYLQDFSGGGSNYPEFIAKYHLDTELICSAVE
ncbi:MAG: hypothetical protein JXR45_10375 [Deltaproteobacteria bacterium]|nr:hypothetical protein [Deltaproteobacteria bacterium]